MCPAGVWSRETGVWVKRRSLWVFVLLFAGCAVPEGRLRLVVVAEGGLEPRVVVEGQGARLEAGQSTTLTLPPGTYSLTPYPARKPGALVDEAYRGETLTPTVQVRPGALAEAAVSYGPRLPGSGFLWFLRRDAAEVAAYAAGRLEASSTLPPDLTLRGTSERPLTDPCGLAVDPQGALWVGNCGALYNAAIHKYAPEQLEPGGEAVPSVTLTYDDPAGLPFEPEALAFLSDGRLVVAERARAALLVYSPEQLRADGAPAPVVVRSSSPGGLGDVADLQLDPAGGAWVVNASGLSKTVVRFAPGQLLASGKVTPEVRLELELAKDPPNTLMAMALEPGGDLWVAHTGLDLLAHYAAGDVQRSGKPAPSVRVGVPGCDPVDLALDNQGGLWVSCYARRTFERYAPADLRQSGNPAPATVLGDGGEGWLSRIWDLAFSPAARAR